MNKFENIFNRVPKTEEKKELDLVVEEVLESYFNDQENTRQHSPRTDHEVHLELLKQKKDERKINNMRDLIRSLAMDFFRKNNRMPHGADLLNKVKEEMIKYQNEKAA